MSGGEGDAQEHAARATGSRRTVATVKVIMLNATPESNVLTASMASPRQHDAGDEPGHGEQQRLGEEREEDGAAPEPERAQRADLGRPARDRGVHGVERAERRAGRP